MFSWLCWSQYIYLLDGYKLCQLLWPRTKIQEWGAQGPTFTLSYPSSVGTVLSPEAPLNKGISAVNLGDNLSLDMSSLLMLAFKDKELQRVYCTLL